MKNRKLNKQQIIFIPLLTLTLFSCGSNNVKLDKASISKDEKYDSATVYYSPDKFNSLGFSLGDSCNITFSNGYKVDDVPYYNGFYVKNGYPVIAAYPGNDYLIITNNNVGIWEEAGLKEGDYVSISLKEKGKYLATQEALGQSYSFNRDEYTSDEEFANFRSLAGGKLKENAIYRGASPVDNSRNRAKITDNLLKKNGVLSIIDLADSLDDYNKYIAQDGFDSTYTKSLFDEGKMILLSMSSSYSLQVYKEAVVKGFKHMLNTEGPYYIHCMEGKDRTGFVCALLEALLGATYDEMCNDYMLTYLNYYKISQDKTPDKYKAVVELYFDAFLETLSGKSDITTLKELNYIDYAKKYLNEGGMSDADIDALINKLSK